MAWMCRWKPLRAAGQMDPVSQRTEQELQVLRDLEELPPSAIEMVRELIRVLKHKKPAAVKARKRNGHNWQGSVE